MIDPTASLNVGPSGLMPMADTPNAGPSADGSGFASAMALAGAAAHEAKGGSDAAAAEPTVLMAAIAPVEADPTPDALQALQATADVNVAPQVDVQALEASFESLAGLAHQFNGTRAETRSDAQAARAPSPSRSPLTSVDSAIAALVEALQFAPRPDAGSAMTADDSAPGLPVADVGATADGEQADDTAEAQLIDPLVGTTPAPVVVPPPLTPAPSGGIAFAAQALPGDAGVARAPLNERKTLGVETRPAAKPAANNSRERQTQALDTQGGTTPGVARSTPAAAEAGKSDVAPAVSEPRAVQPTARASPDTLFQPMTGTVPPAGNTATQVSVGAAAAFQAQLSAAIDSPNFGAALGLQISTLADHGISEARLHLNPAELGPIAVQIGLDGTLAQVHMSVEHSSTRQALEQAMPELAAALRDAGFTMTGGGVSQQPRESQQAPGTTPHGSRAGAADDVPTALATPARPARRGMLDVYA